MDLTEAISYLLLCCNRKRCNGQSQSPSHDASQQQTVGRESVGAEGMCWSLCSSMAPCSALVRIQHEHLSSPYGYDQTTYAFTYLKKNQKNIKQT